MPEHETTNGLPQNIQTFAALPQSTTEANQPPTSRSSTKRHFPKADSTEADDVVTIGADSHTVKEWGQIVGLPLRSMLMRYTRYKETKDGQRFVAKPHKGLRAMEERPAPVLKKGGRKAIIGAFHDAVETEIAPLLAKEIKEYLAKGGNALQLLKDFKQFIPVDAKEQIETQKKASFGLIFPSEPPAEWRKVD